jgi:hypothetical protein
MHKDREKVDQICLKKEKNLQENMIKLLIRKQDPKILIKYMKNPNKIHLKEV